MPDPIDMYCPDTTLWTKKKLLKPCYLLDESMATIVNENEEAKPGVWDSYFNRQKK
jgi:hypothetical protein